jgi:hypothetical protein
MSDPLTVSAILALAFQFANTEAGKASIAKVPEVMTESILKNIGKLRNLIWQKLHGQTDVENILKAAEERGETESLKLAEPYLQIAMNQDPAFADAVKQLAQEIQQSIQIGEMSGGEVWNVVGKAEKNVYTDNKAPIIKDNTGPIHISYGVPPQH